MTTEKSVTGRHQAPAADELPRVVWGTVIVACFAGIAATALTVVSPSAGFRMTCGAAGVIAWSCAVIALGVAYRDAVNPARPPGVPHATGFWGQGGHRR